MHHFEGLRIKEKSVVPHIDISLASRFVFRSQIIRRSDERWIVQEIVRVCKIDSKAYNVLTAAEPVVGNRSLIAESCGTAKQTLCSTQ